MKNFLVILLAGIFPFMAFSQEKAVDPQAKALLDKVISTFETKKGVETKFKVTMDNARNNKKDAFEGSLLLKGDRFRLSVQGVDTYFDGKTQSVVMNKEKEVTISTPEKEDLKEVNPILLMKSSQTDYKMRYLGDSKNEKGVSIEVIELYPNDLNSKYSIIKLVVKKADYQPEKLTLKGKDGVTTHFNIQKISYPKTVDDAEFVYDLAKNPGMEVVDLR